jgi:hypothetical protein
MAAEDDLESIVSRGASASIAVGAILNANQYSKLAAYCI